MRWRLILLSLALGCARTPETTPGTATVSAPLTSAPGLRIPVGERLLDVLGDRALFGRIVPPPPNADPPLRLTARLEQAGRPLPWRYDGVEIAGARLVDRGVLVITHAGELREVGPDAERVLDTGVVGSIGATPDGASLVYARGEPPSLEISRYDRVSGPRPITSGFAPAWSPGISPDGRTVTFVSAKTGVPAWWRISDGGPPVQLTNRDVRSEPGVVPSLTPFAAGLGPTLVWTGGFIFEAEAGVVAMSPSGIVRAHWDAATAPHWVEPGQTVGMVLGDQVFVRLAPEASP